ncbi:hypothetical protein YYC_04481 [Plasmodium yoelii 17X]|uniref:Uncharacterized protein n=1 Tax=Plasmodium yoelii 17X TaxID=1323249 RepID=V7PFW3_PLAYE|nr:hypothetical protein YYC_04481 [Plasmodium yoelii 17X]
MECFLFDSFTLSTINTFIVLDTIIKVLKKKEKGKWREKQKILYLGNKLLIDTFPPNYNFILDFLNVLIEEKTNKNSDSNSDNSNVCKNDDNGRNQLIWNVKKVNDYKRGSIKEINYFNIKRNSHITMEELKNILKNMDIKYVDNEMHLSNLLFKLNKNKKYNIIIINLAFFFLKDKLKLNSFIQEISHFASNLTSNNKTNKNNFENENCFTSKQIHRDSFIQKEICDDLFFKNIINIHFQYSFFVNFFEHLNYVDNFFTFSKKKRSKNDWEVPEINDMNVNNKKNEIKNNISSFYSNKSEQRELNIIDDDDDDDILYHGSNFINHNKLISYKKRTYTENIPINMEKKKMKKNNDFKENKINETDKCKSEISHIGTVKNNNPIKSVYSINSMNKKKKKIYIFDMFPKSESYKKMYMSMISLYFNCVYLIC